MTIADPAARADRLTVHGIDLEVVRRGAGRPILLLHGMQHINPNAPFLELLSRHGEVVAPSHPGFGTSSRPDGFESVYDLTHLYLGLTEMLEWRDVTLVGFSFGGWIAAEIAATRCHRLGNLVLVDAFGIKLSDRETPDILDVFNTHPEEVLRRRWHDPAKWAPDYDAMSDDELTIVARNWDALCLYGWSPYMHNPRLKRWLPRIDVPTLALWGESDGIVRPAYGRTYSDLIPTARFATLGEAGHHPEIEQPEAFVEAVSEFLERKH